MTDILLLLSVFLFGTLVGVLLAHETAKKVARRIVNQECDKRGIQ